VAGGDGGGGGDVDDGGFSSDGGGGGSFRSGSVQIHNRKTHCAVIIIQTTVIVPSSGWTLVDPLLFLLVLCLFLKAGRSLLSPATRTRIIRY